MILQPNNTPYKEEERQLPTVCQSFQHIIMQPMSRYSRAAYSELTTNTSMLPLELSIMISFVVQEIVYHIISVFFLQVDLIGWKQFPLCE